MSDTNEPGHDPNQRWQPAEGVPYEPAAEPYAADPPPSALGGYATAEQPQQQYQPQSQPPLQPVGVQQGYQPPPEPQPGWYNGPYPMPGMEPKSESIGRIIAKTLAKAGTWLAVLFIGSLLGLFGLFLLLAGIGAAAGGSAPDPDALTTEFVFGDEASNNKLLAIPIDGVILGEGTADGGGLFGSLQAATYGYTVQEQLRKAAADDSIDGVILEMDTPGGTIFGSRAINEAVVAYQKDTGKPVVAYVRGISASGGMYAMASADRVLADHGTLIGSIGVIFGPFLEYQDVVAIDGGILGGGVTTEGGITAEFITAGRGKDFGTPWRAMTDEEKQVLQDGVDNAYDDFLDVVATGRGMDAGQIREDLGALLFDEDTATQNGLIDGVASRNDAYAEAAALANIAEDGDWKIERLSTASDGLFGLGLNLPNSGEPGTMSAGAPQPPGFCTGTPMMLALHGDPQVICAVK